MPPSLIPASTCHDTHMSQVLKWLYQGGALSFDDMTNLPKALRAKLGKVATVGALEVCVSLC